MQKSIYSANYKKLLDWLREERLTKGMSMRELAEKMDCPHSLIGKIEQGERRLDVVEYVQYCSELDIDPKIGIDVIKR